MVLDTTKWAIVLKEEQRILDVDDSVDVVINNVCSRTGLDWESTQNAGFRLARVKISTHIMYLYEPLD